VVVRVRSLGAALHRWLKEETKGYDMLFIDGDGVTPSGKGSTAVMDELIEFKSLQLTQ
jgi:hypothetical protein